MLIREPWGRARSALLARARREQWSAHQLVHQAKAGLLNKRATGHNEQPNGDKLKGTEQKPYLGMAYRYDNYYVRFLLGDSGSNIALGGITRAHLEQAKTIVSTFELLLDTSGLDGAADNLNSLTGWRFTKLPKRTHVHVFTDVDESTMLDLKQIFEDHNKWDSLLYGYVRQLSSYKGG